MQFFIILKYFKTLIFLLIQLYCKKRSLIFFSYDVIFLGTKENIIQNFKAFNASIVFAAEVYCWPEKSLADSYPRTESPYKYLNSGGI